MKRCMLLGSLFAAEILAACKPDLATGDWLIGKPRIIAVQADPPEAAPGTTVSYRALWVTPAGDGSGEEALWRFCTAPKASTEDNIVSTSCFDEPSLLPAGSGNPIAATTPKDACSRFGPDTPPGGFRPRDPDETGGYYQPLRIDLPSAKTTFYLSRLLCHLAGAPLEVASRFAQTYVPNHAPILAPLAASIDELSTPLTMVPAGARVRLSLSWRSEDAETYLYFDPATQTLLYRREAMRVAWYVSDGELQTESTGRDEDDTMTTTQNEWVAPARAGTVSFWFVLRDSRGGTTWATYQAVVVVP